MIFKSKSLSALTVGAAVFALLSYMSFLAARTRAAEGPSCCSSQAAGSGRLTLDPALFNGLVRQAYKLAGENPALFAQLHCYCGCDKTDGHKNLLDCFRGQHGSRCDICVGEALEAVQLAQQGTPVDQIRDALRRRFAPIGE